MRKLNWEIKLAVLLLGFTAIVYSVKFLLLKNPGDTLNYVFNSLGFLPVNVLLVTIVLNKLLTIRARREKLEKLNMVIGTFFTEAGSPLLKIIIKSDDNIKNLEKLLLMNKDITNDEIKKIRAEILNYKSSPDISSMDIPDVHKFLLSKRDFLLRLLENPVLLEHETFTELLRAVFHLTEELKCRGEFECLPDSDYAHLCVDIKRVYSNLILQWFDYMVYLKNSYPYLFSLEMRMNPFDEKASPIVKE